MFVVLRNDLLCTDLTKAEISPSYSLRFLFEGFRLIKMAVHSYKFWEWLGLNFDTLVISLCVYG